MTSTRAMFKKPKSVLRRVVNMLLAAVLMLAGPALMITSYQQVDADEELVSSPGFVMPSGADAYMVRYGFGGSPVTWHRATFIKASLPWRYEGVLHEYLECGQPLDRQKLEAILSRRFAGATRDQVAAAANAIMGLSDEWEEMLHGSACLVQENPNEMTEFRLFRRTTSEHGRT